MTAAEEQQMLATLTEIARNISSLSKLVKDLTLQQETADQRAFNMLSQIAHKR